ncbi:MAG TPA: alpha/beta fold hydrolase [Alphaproteobacteria bacterium]|jgi:pimeloyl-ACP methyl ester carboxylesterase
MFLKYHTDLTADVTDIGQGPPLLLIHSAGMGAAQWRALARRLAADCRCVAPNLRGYGRSSAWPEGDPAEVAAELALLEAVAAPLGAPIRLVGHSMGAWLALELARRDPARYASLALVEPVVLGALRRPGEEAALAEVGAMIEDVLAAFARADVAAALERFTDYWYGAGAWAAIPLAQRLPIFARAGKMRADVEAVWRDRTPVAAFAGVAQPALVLSAERTTPAARRMAELVAGVLPGARRGVIAGAGHMAPITHADALAAKLKQFWAETA